MKNSVYIATSLDGFIAGEKGELDWLPQEVPELPLGFEEFMQDVDAIVMGKNTFTTVCAFDVPWPYKKPVFVVSNSLKELAKEYEGKVSLIKGSAKEIVQVLHKEGYKNLYIDGGITVQNFLSEDLIDELIITVVPVLLGNGKTLFGKSEQSLAFECSSSIAVSGVVQSVYRRVKKS